MSGFCFRISMVGTLSKKRRGYYSQPVSTSTFFTTLLAIALLHHQAPSQTRLSAGIKFRHSYKLYWDNGIIMRVSDERLLGHRIELSGSYISSRFGSAMGSHALKEDYFLFSLGLHSRPLKIWDPCLAFSAGHYRYSTEDDRFDFLDNRSAVASLSLGVLFNILQGLGGVRIDAGYNFAGEANLLYPLFYGFTLEINLIPEIIH